MTLSLNQLHEIDKKRLENMRKINKELKNVYTAKQCTDLNDINIALNQIKKIFFNNGKEDTRTLWKRVNALEKKRYKYRLAYKLDCDNCINGNKNNNSDFCNTCENNVKFNQSSRK